MNNCFIILFSVNDEEAGEIPVAFVVKKVGSTLSQKAIMDYVSQQVLPTINVHSSLQLEPMLWCVCKYFTPSLFFLCKVAPYKKVRKVVFIDSVPRSPAGKILKRQLKRDFLTSKL